MTRSKATGNTWIGKLFLKDQGFRRRILAFVCIACFFIGVVGALSNYFFRIQDEQMNELVSQQFPKSLMLGRLVSANHAISQYLLMAQTFRSDPTERAKHIQTVKATVAQFERSLSRLQGYTFDTESQSRIDQLTTEWKKMGTVITKISEIFEKSLSESDPDYAATTTALAAAQKEYNKLSSLILTSLNDLDESAVDTTVDLVLSSKAQASKIEKILIGISVVGAVLLLVIGWVFSKRLVSLLVKITALLSENASKLTSDSAQISESSAIVSTSASAQASALQEAAASIQQVSTMISANSENAHKANDFSRQVEAVSRDTKQSMDELKAAMGDIKTSNRRVSELTQLIEEIRTKTKVIDDIVFKTQLLSFNASIEASRAGKYGTSFAVIAQEIGVLAQISGKAATEISEIVRVGTDEVAAVAAETKARVEVGESLAVKTGVKMVDVLESVTGITEATGKIVEASQEQSAAMGQINSAVSNINLSTADFSEKAKESEGVSYKLSERALSLQSLVQDLNSIVKGRSAARSAQPISMSEVARASGEDSTEDSVDHDDDYLQAA